VAAVLGMVVTSLGCTRAPTQLVIVVDSDLPTASLASVRTRVHAVDAVSSEAPREESWGVPGEVVVPFSFGVVPPGGDGRRRVEIDVEALDSEGRVSVRRRVRTGFLPEQSLRLPVFLAASCTTELERCESLEQTCVDGICVSPDVPTESLTPVTPGSELADASRADAGARADTGTVLPDAGVTIPDLVVPVSVSSFGPEATISAIAFGPDGDVYVGGSTSVAATFFGTAVQPGLVIARLDSDGTPLWVRSWLATDQPSIEAVHVGAIDSAVPVGGGVSILLVLGKADETTGVTEATGGARTWSASGMVGSNVFLAAVSAATGDLLDALVVDGAGDEAITSFGGPGAITQRGDGIMVEAHSASGGAPFTATSMTTRASSMLPSMVMGGRGRGLLFSTRFGTSFAAPSGRVTSRSEGGGVGLASDGRLVSGFGTGAAAGMVTYLGGVAATDIASATGHFALHAIAGLTPALEADWVARVSIRVTSIAGGWPLRTAIAPGGGLVWAATAHGSSTMDQECLSFAIEDTVTAAPGNTGCAVLTAYASDGTLALSPILLGRAQTFNLHLAADAAGNVYETGRAGGDVVLGVGQSVTSMPAGGGPYVSSHARDGSFRWTHAWPSQYSDVAAIGVAANGDVWLAGSAFAGFTLTPSSLRAATGGFLVRMSAP